MSAADPGALTPRYLNGLALAVPQDIANPDVPVAQPGPQPIPQPRVVFDENARYVLFEGWQTDRGRRFGDETLWVREKATGRVRRAADHRLSGREAGVFGAALNKRNPDTAYAVVYSEVAARGTVSFGYEVNLRSGRVRQLLDGSRARILSIEGQSLVASPDGRFLAFSANHSVNTPRAPDPSRSTPRCVGKKSGRCA